MKKVLYVATVTRHINAFHIKFLKMFKEKGYEVHVASNGDENIPFCDKHYNLPFERFPLKFNNIEAYRKLKKIVCENDYEIIHSHTPVGGVLARLAARKARKRGTKSIYTAHGFHFYKGAPIINWLLYYPIEKICSKWTDCLITINKEDYDRAKKKFKIKQIELVNGVGINVEQFNISVPTNERDALKSELGVSKDDFVFINIGELNKNKNQILIIDAMKNIVKKYNNIKVLLISDGILKEYYTKKINEYNLQESIKLLGYRSDIPKLLNISNCLLSLSYREGLPVNVMEAIASNVPVIATDCRGNRDLIKNEINGFIIKNNQKDLEKAIIDMMDKNKTFIFDTSTISDTYVMKKMQDIYNI